jgi:hypothetical protein
VAVVRAFAVGACRGCCANYRLFSPATARPGTRVIHKAGVKWNTQKRTRAWKGDSAMSGRGRAALQLRQWAAEEGVEIAALKACGRPPDSVLDEFPYLAPVGLGVGRLMPGLYWVHFHYFEITTIDADHVRRSGVARVRCEIHSADVDQERMVDFVWSTFEQLNWRDRPPRRSAEVPGARTEGWSVDHTGAHELRWYSVGTPTDLVKDGAIESRDPPAPHGVR